MLSYTTLQNLISIARMIIDIAIITVLLYYGLKIIRNNTRTIQIFKGVLLVIFLNAFATFFGLKTVSVVANILVQWGFLAIIIIFQPEIRGLLEKIGKTSVFSRITNLSGDEKENLVDELVTASVNMASERVGALITIEQSQSLSDYIKTGTPMNSIVTADLLCSIFVTTTPLHDGAVIIQGDKIACASAYFLPTERNLPRRFGARHRAAVGISEITDSISIVVSEETGNISIAQNGELTKMTDVSLKQFLQKFICHEEVERTEGSMIIKEIDRKEDDIIYQSIIKEEAGIVDYQPNEENVESLSENIKNRENVAEEVKENSKEEKKEDSVLSILFKKKEKKEPAKKTDKKVTKKTEEDSKKEETNKPEVIKTPEEVKEIEKVEEPKEEFSEDTKELKVLSEPKKEPKILKEFTDENKNSSVKLEFSAADDLDDFDVEELINKMKGGH